MPKHPQDSTPPALDLLRLIAARGAHGVSPRELFDEGPPTQGGARLVDALRSRGYVRFDGATRHWVATPNGVLRADADESDAPPSLTQR